MSDENVGYDKQDPKPWTIAVAVIAIMLFTFISGWAVQAYFEVNSREQYTRTVLQSPNTALNTLRAESAKQLKMPMEEAMKLAIADIKAKAAQPASAPTQPTKKK